MMKKLCDHCGKEFSETDKYVDAKIKLSYKEYLGDDGSQDIFKIIDLCSKCFNKVLPILVKK